MRHFLLAAFLTLPPNLATAGEPALIVVAGPMSGPGAAATRTIREAADAEAQALNAGGGILGRQVAVETVEDGCAGTSAELAAHAIVTKQAALVLGHPCTRASLAAARVYGAAKVLYIASSVRQPGLTRERAGPTILRSAGRDDRQGEAAAGFLANRFKDKRIALVSDRTQFARLLVEQTRKGLSVAGAADVTLATIVAGEKDYAGLIAALRQPRPPAAILFAGFGVEAAIILGGLRRAGMAALMLVPDAAVSEDLMTGLEGGALDSVCALFSPDGAVTSGSRPESGEAARGPTAGAGRTRLALAAWAHAVAAVQSLDGMAVAGRLTGGPLETTRGWVSFDKSGDLVAPSFGVKCRSGGQWIDDPG